MYSANENRYLLICIDILVCGTCITDYSQNGHKYDRQIVTVQCIYRFRWQIITDEFRRRTKVIVGHCRRLPPATCHLPLATDWGGLRVPTILFVIETLTSIFALSGYVLEGEMQKFIIKFDKSRRSEDIRIRDYWLKKRYRGNGLCNRLATGVSLQARGTRMCVCVCGTGEFVVARMWRASRVSASARMKLCLRTVY